MEKELNYNKALEFQKNGYYEESIEYFSKVTNLDPNFKNALFGLGYSYYRKGSINEALVHLNNAAKIKPDYVNTHIVLGRAYFGKANYEDALVSCNNVIRLEPDDSRHYLNRGNVFYFYGNLDRALVDLDKAIELDIKYVQAYNYRGKIHSQKGNHNDAIKDFNFSEELSPNNLEVYIQRGIAYFRNDEFGKAILDFNKAIVNDPSNLVAYKNRGASYARLDKYEEAISDFNNVIELDPNSAETYNNRAFVFGLMGEFQKAYSNIVMVEELCNNKIELIDYRENLIIALNTLNAPFLFYRIINQIYAFINYSVYTDFIIQNQKECNEVITLLEYLEKSNLIEKIKFEIFKGVVTYYMKDPSVCYRIFRENVNKDSPYELMCQYYSILSCDDYLKSESESILKNAVKKANDYFNAERMAFDNLQSYYAGQIFFINSEFLKALVCFSECNDFIPAICMKALCNDVLEKNNERDLLLDEIVFLDKHNKGILQYINIPNLSIEYFEETVLKYSHIREIEGVIPLLNEYMSNKKSFFTLKNKYSIPESDEIFSIDEDTKEGKATIAKIKLWKNEVIEWFCQESEKSFEQKIKDHFELWKKESDREKLEFSLGSDIPLFCLDKEINIINLIDYFSVKEKLNNDARYLLIFWTELCKFKNQKLSESQKTIVKYSISYTFKITLGFFGIPNLFIPSVILFIGEQFTKGYFTDLIIKFVEDSFIRSDERIPEFYIDFKKQFREYIYEKKLTEDFMN